MEFKDDDNASMNGRQCMKKGTKIKAIIALVFPLLYGFMCLPIWNGRELPSGSIGVWISGICFLLAIVNFYLVFVKKTVKVRVLFDAMMIVSVLLTCLVGIFFVEGLMGIPLFLPQS